jgi:hypothetical protein
MPRAPAGGLEKFSLRSCKLKGCGTHMEQIGYVHDLFR